MPRPTQTRSQAPAHRRTRQCSSRFLDAPPQEMLDSIEKLKMANNVLLEEVRQLRASVSVYRHVAKRLGETQT